MLKETTGHQGFPIHAMISAADHIEANPHLYDWMETKVPENSSCSACALGWLEFFAGFPCPGDSIDNGISDVEFYHAMSSIQRWWMYDPHTVARCLCALAEEN